MQTPLKESQIKNLVICSWCKQPAQIIWVHGHGQCSVCGTNIDECCRGEQCDNESSNFLNLPDDKNQ